jgi:hypothetical protein
MFKVDATKLRELSEAREREWRGAELSKADIQVNRMSDSGQNAKAWRDYRIALRDWPKSPGFPEPAQRPKAPE